MWIILILHWSWRLSFLCENVGKEEWFLVKFKGFMLCHLSSWEACWGFLPLRNRVTWDLRVPDNFQTPTEHPKMVISLYDLYVQELLELLETDKEEIDPMQFYICQFRFGSYQTRTKNVEIHGCTHPRKFENLEFWDWPWVKLEFHS